MRSTRGSRPPRFRRPRRGRTCETESGSLLLMPAHGRPGVGVKLVTLTDANPDRRPALPPRHLRVVRRRRRRRRSRCSTGRCSRRSGRRRSADSRRGSSLAPDASRLVLFGAGVQARSHLEAMRAVRPVRGGRGGVANARTQPRPSRQIARSEGLDASVGDPRADRRGRSRLHVHDERDAGGRRRRPAGRRPRERGRGVHHGDARAGRGGRAAREGRRRDARGRRGGGRRARARDGGGRDRGGPRRRGPVRAGGRGRGPDLAERHDALQVRRGRVRGSRSLARAAVRPARVVRESDGGRRRRRWRRRRSECRVPPRRGRCRPRGHAGAGRSPRGGLDRCVRGRVPAAVLERDEHPAVPGERPDDHRVRAGARVSRSTSSRTATSSSCAPKRSGTDFVAANALQRSLGVEAELLTPEDAERIVPGIERDGLVGATFGPERWDRRPVGPHPGIRGRRQARRCRDWSSAWRSPRSGTPVDAWPAWTRRPATSPRPSS